ncbi:MAG TPA: hypothetical protein VFM09_07905 [Marmoricola sp.]|nr:hypothetical protein [Marmoricola sp.]
MPKTGTTFLQRLLRRNAALLREHGVLYPGPGPAAQFHAAIEVRKMYDYWGAPAERIDGTWERLCGEARAFRGTSILGHEILAAARPAQIERVAADLSDVDLHVVVTVRDLGRQIPAWWQEWVKNGSDAGFAEVMGRRVLPEWDAEEKRSPFWRSQDLVDVLRRWGAAVPPKRTHVVISPPPGAGPQELWHRFGDAVGIPRGLEVDPGPPSNESLGVTEIALLRATNRALDGRLVQPHYGPVVKHWLSQEVLSPRSSPRPMLPSDWHDRVESLTARWLRHLEESGVHVHGSLEDLHPVLAEPDVPAPDDVAAEDLAGLAPRAVADMLLEVSRLRQELAAARQRERAAAAPKRLLAPVLRGGARVRRVARRAGRRTR